MDTYYIWERSFYMQSRRFKYIPYFIDKIYNHLFEGIKVYSLLIFLLTIDGALNLEGAKLLCVIFPVLLTHGDT